MARRTRTRRLLGTIAGTALATGAALVTAPPTSAETAPAAAASVTVRPDPSYKEQSFEGWGTSLVWFANATGNYPAPIREKLAKLLFGDDGLNLNMPSSRGDSHPSALTDPYVTVARHTALVVLFVR
ncbi:hypothetical protein ACFXKC_48265, partial [Streptomyces sp. NPDC059340]